MRKSSIGTILLTLLTALALGIVSLLFFQDLWLKKVQQMLSSNQSFGLPVSSTMPVSNFSFPTAQAPAGFNTELTVGNLGITVTGIVSPANHVVGNANRFNVLEKDEEYLIVYIKTRCVSQSETCRITESDFGIESNSGQDYPAEFSTSYSDSLKGYLKEAISLPGKTWAAH